MHCSWSVNYGRQRARVSINLNDPKSVESGIVQITSKVSIVYAVYISGSNEEAYPPILEAIGNNPETYTLDCCIPHFPDVLVNFLKTNTTITSMHLNNTPIEDTTPIAEVLKVNRTLLRLSLCQCKILYLIPLAGSLIVNTSLNILFLTSNDSVEGWDYLWDALCVNTSLENLYIPWCNTKDTYRFREMIKVNTGLKRLVTDSPTKDFVTFVQTHNPKLQVL